MITVYHCSPDLITEFNFDFGVHFGGLYSAIEAGLRKLSQLKIYQSQDYSEDVLYLYTCTLNTKQLYEGTDVGGLLAWDFEIQKAIDLNADGIKYTNLYEPDSKPSYLILNSEVIQVVKSEEVLSLELENKLEDHLRDLRID